MTPQEKAQELFDKYFTQIRMPSDCEGCMQCVDRCESMVYVAKKYALIAVNEIINAETYIWGGYNRDEYRNYFQAVKQEIEKL